MRYPDIILRVYMKLSILYKWFCHTEDSLHTLNKAHLHDVEKFVSQIQLALHLGGSCNLVLQDPLTRVLLRCQQLQNSLRKYSRRLGMWSVQYMYSKFVISYLLPQETKLQQGKWTTKIRYSKTQYIPVIWSREKLPHLFQSSSSGSKWLPPSPQLSQSR